MLIGCTQLCKIDLEGKARKVVGCPCVVVKVKAVKIQLSCFPTLLDFACINLLTIQTIPHIFAILVVSLICRIMEKNQRVFTLFRSKTSHTELVVAL